MTDALATSLPPAEDVELQARFEALQANLVQQWKLIEAFTDDPRTIVVVPSLSIDLPLDAARMQAYEERFLFLLLLLRQPRARLVYVTSLPVPPALVDYYLGLLPGVPASHARARLDLLSPQDATVRPLTAKLLARPRLLARIAELAGDPTHGHIVPFNTTPLERDLALRLGIPMYAADPKFTPLGTKSGSRALFREAGIAHPEGREGVRSVPDLVEAVAALLAARPGLERVVVKHDEGVAGFGNAVLDVTGLDGSRAAIERRLAELRPEGSSVSREDYLEKLADGGVVEELISGPELHSPSVQMRATPLGDVELLSTHDQLLGGASGQSFVGSVFPADESYAREIAEDARAVGRLLAARGVLGRFAVDFLTVRRGDTWDRYAIELNLRKGGTTHPYLTLEFLTDGRYDGERALFVTPKGQTKFFVSTDRLESPAYRVFQPDEVFDVAVRERLHFDHTTETGVVFHMLSALGTHGVLGVTAMGHTREDAKSLFERTRDAFDREAAAAAEHDALPRLDA
jgi:hypothetical protein